MKCNCGDGLKSRVACLSCRQYAVRRRLSALGASASVTEHFSSGHLPPGRGWGFRVIALMLSIAVEVIVVRVGIISVR